MKDNGLLYGFLFTAGLLAFYNKDFSSDVDVHTESTPEPLFQDINGDDKKDLVYGVESKIWNSCRENKRWSSTLAYDVCFRENLGNGDYAPEKCVLRIDWNKPNLQLLYQREEDSGKDVCSPAP